MNAAPKLSRIVLSSPLFLFVFLVVPIMVILNLTMHAGIPFVGPRLLLGSNICFTALVLCRLIRYLSRLGQVVRYDRTVGKPSAEFDSQHPMPEAMGVLAGDGYAFTDGGEYGEKRDLGYLGTVILYFGLLILLATGSWDNLRQFAGVLLDGVGPSTKLSKVESYRSLNRGPLAGNIEALPQLRILSQILPDSTYPKGATEIALLPEHGEPLTTVLMPSVPFRYGSYDISMSKLVYEAQLVIKTKDGQTLLDSLVKLDPLVQKRGNFSFYGLFVGAGIVGGAYFQPESSLMMVVITRNGKREVADMTFQVDQQVTKGDYILSCAKMGQWSEIHVIHRRHKILLYVGGIIAFLGLALRMAVRPQRVWLKGTDGGCRVAATGADVQQALRP